MNDIRFFCCLITFTDYEDYQSGSIQPGEESGAGGGDSSLSIDETK